MSEDRLVNEEPGTQEIQVPENEREESVATVQDKNGDDLAELEVEAKPSLEERLVESEAKAAEYLDGWQRARAEFANARKRLERERAEAYGTAAVDFVKRLLPILDDLDRAIDSAPPEIAENRWFEGLDLVNRKIRSILDSLDVHPIEALGEPFDPNFHEALALKEADGVESGLVIEELQTGYRLGDRVIRPSLVNVSA